MHRSARPSSLHVLFGLLAGVASLMAIQSLVWPRWPSVAPLDAEAIGERLRANGFEARPLPVLPARRSFERASSEVPGFAIGKGETLRLLRGSTRDRFMLDVANLAPSDPALVLKQRRLFAGPPPFAQGSIKGSPARQTCLVIGRSGSGGFGVTEAQLLPLVDQLPAGRWQRLEVVLGLRLPRSYECVLIQVSGGSAGSDPEHSRWAKLLSSIRPALAHGASTD